jgi:peptidoglycan/xylan/chitin deacetylase (PgdA/CDA1 family)
MGRGKTMLIETASRTRALELALKLKRSPPIILMYHGVSVSPVSDGLRNCEGKHITPDLFVTHLQKLQRTRRVISLKEMMAGLQGKQDMSNTVALTFDDGYENNLLAAIPLLTDFKMPATFFLATGFIGEERCIWFDKLEIALEQTKATSFNLPDNGGSMPIATFAEKRQALSKAKKMLKAKATRSLDEEVVKLIGQLGVTGFHPEGDYRFMTWDQVREIARAGFEIGAHTVTHPILSKIPYDDAVAEILGSRERVQQEVGQCSPTFCFPNGKMSDFSPELKAMCQQHFNAVLTAERGVASSDELFELKRLSPSGPGKGENIEWMMLRAN